MPYNGSGVYTPPSLPGSWSPAISGQPATPADWNSLLTDLSSALSTAITRDGQTTVTDDIPFGGFRLTDVGAATLPTDAPNAIQVQDGLGYAADTGAADLYAIAPGVPIAAYVVGQIFGTKIAHTNATTTPTLAVSGLTAGLIKWPDGSAPAVGDLLLAAEMQFMVASVTTGTPVFHIQTAANFTGTGKLVKSISPALTGAPTAPTQTAGDNSTKLATTAYVDAASVPRSYIAGLTLSTAGSSGTFGIAVGQATDSTNVASLVLASAYTKTTSAWAVGSGNGGLDTGSIANATWYHVYLIKRVDTGVVDVIVSTNATSPTLPTNYTLYRRIGSMLTNGSAQWTAFIQSGSLFQWLAPVADISSTNPGTSAVTRALTVPLGINVLANLQFGVINVGSGGAAFGYLSDLATTDTAPSGGGVSDVSDASNATGGVAGSYSRLSIRTNTSRQIRSRISFSDGSVSISIYTLGWTDSRGMDN